MTDAGACHEECGCLSKNKQESAGRPWFRAGDLSGKATLKADLRYNSKHSNMQEELEAQKEHMASLTALLKREQERLKKEQETSLRQVQG